MDNTVFSLCSSLENLNRLRRYRVEFRHCSSKQKHNTKEDTVTVHSQARKFFVRLFLYKNTPSTPNGRTMFISLYDAPHNEHVQAELRDY